MKKLRFLSLILVLCMAASSALAVDYMVPEDMQTYPITEEKITLSYWYPYASALGELSDFNESEFYQWYEEKTGIHIEFEVPAVNTESSAFQLLFASDDMPDMVYTFSSQYKYRGGEDKAIEDGYFVDIAEYLHLAPNYSAWLDQHPELKKAAYTDTGKMYGFWCVWLPIGNEVMADNGLAIRKDFLDAVGMDVPVTYDDWYNALTAFKNELGIEAPYYTSKYGIDVYGDFMAGYGTAPYFYQVDGQVKYGPMDDEYRDYLAMMNKWWEEGLLDHDFATRASTGITADNDMMLNDKVGSLTDFGTRLSDAYVTRGASNPDFFLVGTQQPVKEVGDTPKYRTYSNGNNMMAGTVVSISADSPYIEEAVRWLDGYYAMDVYLNANYGVEEQEGVVWYADPTDGHRIGDYDFRYSNPNGLSSATVAAKYWARNPPVRMEAAQFEQSDETRQAGWKIWSTFEPEWWISARVTMTADEGTEYASLYTDIETYVQECNVKFIMGQMSLNEYDAYRETLTKMKIERCIELQQMALDRFNAR